MMTSQSASSSSTTTSASAAAAAPAPFSALSGDGSGGLSNFSGGDDESRLVENEMRSPVDDVVRETVA